MLAIRNSSRVQKRQLFLSQIISNNRIFLKNFENKFSTWYICHSKLGNEPLSTRKNSQQQWCLAWILVMIIRFIHAASGTEHAWISRAESNVREYHGYIMDGIMNRRRSGTPGCTNIFMRVESGTKLQWDITKFLGEGKIETVKTRGQVGRLEFILEKANTASSGIYYSCPDTRHHFSILSPLSVLRNANGASAIRRPSRRVVPPREVFSKYP